MLSATCASRSTACCTSFTLSAGNNSIAWIFVSAGLLLRERSPAEDKIFMQKKKAAAKATAAKAKAKAATAKPKVGGGREQQDVGQEQQQAATAKPKVGDEAKEEQGKKNGGQKNTQKKSKPFGYYANLAKVAHTWRGMSAKIFNI